MKLQVKGEGREEEDCWTELGMVSKTRDCQGRKCMTVTVLHGCVCHRTSTPNGNKMKEKNHDSKVERAEMMKFRCTVVFPLEKDRPVHNCTEEQVWR